MAIENALAILKEATRHRASLESQFFLFRSSRDLFAIRAVQATAYLVLLELGHKEAADDALQEVVREARKNNIFTPLVHVDTDSFLKALR